MVDLDAICSRHARKRMLARKISLKDILMCINYGQKIHRTGIRFYFLGYKDISRQSLPGRLSGLCVLVAKDGTVITVYKNQQGLSMVKKLAKDDLRKFH